MISYLIIVVLVFFMISAFARVATKLYLIAKPEKEYTAKPIDNAVSAVIYTAIGIFWIYFLLVVI